MLMPDPPAARSRSLAPAITVAAMLVVMIVYVRLRGRVWWCQQGDWSPMSFVVWSPHNSQHLLDAYSLSHLLHGILFFGVLWFFRSRISLPWRFVIAAAVEVAWEMLENSPIIIDRYRAATISLGYEGDSIVNSIGDVVSFAIGFWIARKLGLWWSIAAFLVIELAMLFWMRDNLALNVLMLLWPVDAVRKWQSSGG